MSFDTTKMPPYNASDPSATFLSSSALDFLLIELVPLARRIATERDTAAAAAASAAAAHADAEADMVEEAGAEDAASRTTTGAAAGGAATATAGTRAGGGGSGGGGVTERDEDEETMAVMQHRLDMQGYRVGQGLVERFSRDRPRFNDTLDVIKFLCKDLWSLVFGKNIDNLKTNHRGVFVLTDNVFRPFSRMSTDTGGQAVVRAQPFLFFPCGIVRGALAALGVNATVQAEVSQLPGAVFQIKTLAAKA